MPRPKRKEASESRLIIAPYTETKNEEWKHFSFRSAANDGIDCGDKQCYVEYRVVPDCYLILETNSTKCKIPCTMNGCDRELHHFIPCPIWTCDPITTSTSSTTTTTQTTTSTTDKPQPNPIKPNMSPLIYTSIVLNIFFFAIVCAFVVVKGRKQITTRLARRHYQNLNETNPNRFFSLDGNDENEADPLITDEANTGPINHGSLESQSNLSLVNRNVVSNDSPAIRNETRAIVHDSPAIMEGIENLALDISNEIRTDPNWQDINLQNSAAVCDGATGPIAAVSLNATQPEETKQKESPVFFLMKNFRKK